MSDFGFSKDELKAEAFWRKCERSPEFFFSEFWKIQHPERGSIPFDLRDPQRRALEVFQNERYVVTLKARQIGWTTLVAAYAFWLTFFKPDISVIFLSKGEREARQILEKVRYGLKRLPQWMRSRGPKVLRDNLQEMPFDNGSSVESLPSKSDPARGRTVYLVIVDEWAFLENPDEAWASIEPITDVGGRCIGLSTANGIGNFFYELWNGSETGVNLFKPIFEPWSANTDRDENWYESKRKSLPKWQLHQEYPRSPEEAFIKSGNPFFDVDRLMTLETRDGRRGSLVDRNGLFFEEWDDGPLEIWESPIMGETYVIGADVAEGLPHGDFSSAHVKRIRSGEVVAHWHGHLPTDEFGGILAHLGRFYNTALIGIENNGIGQAACNALKATRYPNIFYSRVLDERTRRETRKIGWITSRKTKPLICDDLYAALRDDSIIVHCKYTIKELKSFIRDENAKLHGQPWDDRTMSLAITEQMSNYAMQPEYRTDQIEWGSLQWWEGTLVEEHVTVPIGAHNVRSRV